MAERLLRPPEFSREVSKWLSQAHIHSAEVRQLVQNILHGSTAYRDGQGLVRVELPPRGAVDVLQMVNSIRKDLYPTLPQILQKVPIIGERIAHMIDDALRTALPRTSPEATTPLATIADSPSSFTYSSISTEVPGTSPPTTTITTEFAHVRRSDVGPSPLSQNIADAEARYLQEKSLAMFIDFADARLAPLRDAMEYMTDMPLYDFSELLAATENPDIFRMSMELQRRLPIASAGVLQTFEELIPLHARRKENYEFSPEDEKELEQCCMRICAVATLFQVGIHDHWIRYPEATQKVGTVMIHSAMEAMFLRYLAKKFPTLFASIESQKELYASKTAAREQRDLLVARSTLLAKIAVAVQRWGIAEHSKKKDTIFGSVIQAHSRMLHQGLLEMRSLLFMADIHKTYTPKHGETPFIAKKPIPEIHHVMLFSNGTDFHTSTFHPGRIPSTSVMLEQHRQERGAEVVWHAGISQLAGGGPSHSPLVFLSLEEILGKDATVTRFASYLASGGASQLAFCETTFRESLSEWIPLLSKETVHMLTAAMNDGAYASTFILPMDFAQVIGEEPQIEPDEQAEIYDVLQAVRIHVPKPFLLPVDGMNLPFIDNDERETEDLKRLVQKCVSDDGRRNLWKLPDARQLFGQLGIALVEEHGRGKHPKAIGPSGAEHAFYPKAFKDNELYAADITEIIVYFGLEKKALEHFAMKEGPKKKKNGNKKH